MAEQRKAQKRVNALKYNIIPRYRDTIRYIESVLEEEERNVLFQIKRLREKEERNSGGW
jgi:V/A-type H+-transporting ATPase subunit D